MPLLISLSPPPTPLLPSLRLCRWCKVRIPSHTKDENHNLSVFFINGNWLENYLRSDRRWATDELALSETHLAGGQKLNRTFLGSIVLLESLLLLIRPLFGASHGVDFHLSQRNNRFRKGPYAPKKVLFEGINFLLLLLPFFLLVREQPLKGIIYPLAVKSTQVLDLAHQKERIALV